MALLAPKFRVFVALLGEELGGRKFRVFVALLATKFRVFVALLGVG